MKGTITLLIILASVASTFAQVLGQQVTLSFCPAVERDGTCDFGNTKFFSNPDGSMNDMYMRIHSENVQNISKIVYKIYSITKDGEMLTLELPETVEPGWVFAWQKCQFNIGKFMVRVFDEHGALLCNQSLEFYDWKKF